MPPIPLPPVSGRYRGRRGDFEVELRIDVDGARPMNRVSADYFQGRDRLYAGSMCVDDPTVTTSASLLTITGHGRTTWTTDANHVTVTIPRSPAGGRATLTHSTARDGAVRARYECEPESASFRKVSLEEDAERGVKRFESYDTATLEAPCAPRTLTHLTAFGDAGIEMVRSREPGIVESTGASWSDAELQAAMVAHFKAFADVPQWSIWLLHARLHDNDRAGRGYLGGLMFDQRGRQRQGSAIFYQGLRGKQEERPRLELFTCVHELAHGFNLLHSFEKSLAVPPIPSRPDSPTWMAYPDSFPEGPEAFWSRFGFQFDDPELVHLRHAMRDDVIMGGNPFTAGAAFEQDADAATRAATDPGLRLALVAPPAVPYGVPVTIDIELWGTTQEGRSVPSVLGPRVGNVAIAIRGPNRAEFVFEPLLRHCRVDDALVLRAGDPPVRDSAFIHYGKDGFAFEEPGRYEVRARCIARHDGCPVLSNVVHIDVKAPVTPADRAVAELAYGHEQGVLMSLVGSDSPELRRGNESLRMIEERYPNHPVAAVAKLIRGSNAARDFNAVQLDGAVRVRRAQPQALAAMLRDTPTLEALRRAGTRTVDAAELPRAFAQALSRVPIPGDSGRALDAYVRSRINEITKVIPHVLAFMRQPLPPEVVLGNLLDPQRPPSRSSSGEGGGA